MGDFKWISWVVAIATAIVYGIKVWDDLSRPECDSNGENCKPPKTKGSLFRQSLYGAFGSGIVCLLICEGLIYYANVPFNLALLIGALCGFTGADAFKELLLRFIERQFISKKESKNE